MIVAIDGPAGVGKSTLARCVAESAGFVYLNSGNLYRAITLVALRAGVDAADGARIAELSGDMDLALEGDHLLLDGERVGGELRSDDVDAQVALVSSHPVVRDRVNELLVKLADGNDVVVEGRDMTTVVFPDAEVRVYLDASLDARARRRMDQGTSSLELEELKTRIARRDRIDEEKAVGALRRAPGVLYLDSSYLTIGQVCEKVMDTIRDTR